MSIRAREKRIKPFLRWAGGKAWFVENLQRLIDGKEFTDYYEPFVGGGSVFFSLEFKNASIHISDSNEELINTYIAVRDNPDRVIEFIKRYRNTEKFYYSLRNRTPRDFYEKAARFIYLNHTSYNGIYRVNRQGKYNVPFGKRAKIGINSEIIHNASAALKNVDISSCDFGEALKDVSKGALVFLDPPYTVSHNNNGFIEYNKNIFSIEDQERLAQCIKEIEKKGAYYILTNAAHEAIKDIFNTCGTSIVVERKCTIGGKNAKRGGTQELIFTNLV